jgi:hypothetical protein
MSIEILLPAYLPDHRKSQNDGEEFDRIDDPLDMSDKPSKSYRPVINLNGST